MKTINKRKVNDEKWRSFPLFIFLLSFFIFFAGCSSDDDTGTLAPEKGSEVQFNIGFAPQVQTRVATDVAFNSTFEDGDEIGVFALKEGTTDVVAQNVKLVRTSGNWAVASNADKIYYPLDGQNLDFYAYYPYQGDENTAIDALTFAVESDQSTAVDYSQSDLLTASSLNQSANLVGLSFSHLMAMVQVTVKSKSPVPAFREGADGFKVILKKVKHSTEAINWATNTAELAPSATAEDITMHRVPTTDGSWVFRALIPSQQLAAGDLFAFKQALQGNVIDMDYSLIAAISPAMGKASSYTVTLDYQLDPDHEYAIGDTYPYKGTPVGIVYYIEPGGKNGKIVSLDESPTTMRWSTEDKATGTTTDDGKANMTTIKGMNSDLSKYPPFKWCAAKGNNWYLPAKDELQYLYCAYNGRTPETWNNGTPSWNADQTARDTFNGKLTDAAGDALSNNYHWSSSEDGNYPAWVVLFSDGYASSPFKFNYLYVRAVSAF